MTRASLIRLCLALLVGLGVGCGDKRDSDAHDHDKPAVDAPEKPHDAGMEPGNGDEDPFAALGPEDAKLARAQKTCPVSDEELGDMGTPVKVMVGDTPVFLCCNNCRKQLLADPDKYLAKLGK